MNVYADHAATTPLDPEVLDSMLPYLGKHFGNPSSVHQFGQKAHVALNNARKTVADALGCNMEEIIFTGSATESSNMILKGYAQANKDKGNHIITTTIEHDCILETCRALEQEGFEVTYVPTNEEGLVTADQIEKVIQKETILISIMSANNEIGSILPIQEIGKLAQERGIFFHTDAVQYYGYFPCTVNEMNVDALTLSAHKFYGPKGVGLLYVKGGTVFQPLFSGGGQEFEKRSGTHNVPGIVGMAKAMQLIEVNREIYRKQVEELRDFLLEEIKKKTPNIRLNGPKNDRLPNNINIRFEGIQAGTLLMRLDIEGIAVSTGSACSMPSNAPSHVLKAIGLSEKEAEESLRITLGKDTTRKEIIYMTEILQKVVDDLHKQ